VGIHVSGKQWIPAFAGMTIKGNVFQLTFDHDILSAFILKIRPIRILFFIQDANLFLFRYYKKE